METSGVSFNGNKAKINETAENKRKENIRTKEGSGSADVIKISDDVAKANSAMVQLADIKAAINNSPTAAASAQGGIQKWDVVKVIFDAFLMISEQLQLIKDKVGTKADVAFKAQANVAQKDVLSLVKET